MALWTGWQESLHRGPWSIWVCHEAYEVPQRASGRGPGWML